MQFQQTPWKHDPRDDRFTEIAFGAPVRPVFPKTLGRTRRRVKNQGNSLSCTAHGATLASEYQENIELSAAWQWSRICERLGTYVPNGADYRIAFRTLMDWGSLPESAAPYHFPQDNPQVIGNWNNWPESLKEGAELFKKAAYVKIPRVGDHFDSVKAALVNGQSKGQIVVTCTAWLQGWENTYIPHVELPLIGYHCHTWIDFDTIDGVEYLIGQNSYGEDFADNGCQYWPREVVNRELEKWGCGAFVFVDLTPEQIALAKQETPFGYIQRLIIQVWVLIAQKYGLTR